MKETERKRDFLVIGLGRFGSHLAETLMSYGVSVMLLDNNPKNLEPFQQRPNCGHRICDATKEEELARVLEDSEIQSAVICIGENITASVLIALLLKNHNVLHIYARANTREHAEILRLLGVAEIIEPERETAQKWARTLVNQGDLIVSYQDLSDNHVLVEMTATGWIVNSTVENLNLRRDFKLNIVGIRRRIEQIDEFENYSAKIEEELQIPPDPQYKIQGGDRLILAGRDEHIQRFKESLLKENP